MKKVFVLICIMLFGFAGFRIEASPSRCNNDVLIRILVEKGILTEDEAREVAAEAAAKAQTDVQRPCKKAAGAARAAERRVPAPPPMKFSAQIRFRSEFKSNSDFSDLTQDHNDFTGQRIRLDIDGRASEARYFVQLQDTRIWGGELLTGAAGSIDNVDLHQGFVELGEGRTLRIGRQEVTLGSQRLVGSFGWSNNGRAFDGVRLLAPTASGMFDIYALKAVEGATTATDDTNLYGLVYNWSSSRILKPSLYVLFKDADATGVDKTKIYTFGNITKLNFDNGLSLDWEVDIQSGDTGGQDHDALAWHIGMKYAFPGASKLWIGSEYNFASGDDDATKSKTFDQLYPTNHGKYGFIDYQGWKNMKNLRLSIGGDLGRGVSTQLDYHKFKLDESTDSWYKASGAANMTDATGAAGTDVGSELDLTLKYTCPKGYKFQAGYSRFFTGDFIDNINGASSDDSDWGYLQLLKDFR